jgi:hypothetical protein
MILRTRIFRHQLLLWMMTAAALWMSSSSTVQVVAFQYKKDTEDNCADKVDNCTKSDNLWFQCPISCSQNFEKEGSMAEVAVDEDPEEFYNLQVTKANGNIMELEDFEGYVTVYAILPLLPGMAQFYYELLEHVQSVYPYTVEMLVLPYRLEEEQDVTIQLHEKPKVTVLQETMRPTNVLDFIANAPIVAGNEETEFFVDRVTVWLVSVDGRFFERLVSPTVTLLEQRIPVFLKQLGWKPEL